VNRRETENEPNIIINENAKQKQRFVWHFLTTVLVRAAID
jgi:hypothetical protein